MCRRHPAFRSLPGELWRAGSLGCHGNRIALDLALNYGGHTEMDDSFHHGLVLFASNPPGGGSDPRGANRGRRNAVCQGRVAPGSFLNGRDSDFSRRRDSCWSVSPRSRPCQCGRRVGEGSRVGWSRGCGSPAVAAGHRRLLSPCCAARPNRHGPDVQNTHQISDLV